MRPAYFKHQGYNLFIDQLIGDNYIMKQQNVLVCNSQTAYSILFINGLTDDAIKDAGILAMRLVRDKINSY